MVRRATDLACLTANVVDAPRAFAFYGPAKNAVARGSIGSCGDPPPEALVLRLGSLGSLQEPRVLEGPWLVIALFSGGERVACVSAEVGLGKSVEDYTASAPIDALISLALRRGGDLTDLAIDRRRLIDGLFAAISVTDSEGALLEANRVAMDAAGVEPGEVLGLPLELTPWWAHDQLVQDDLRQALDFANSGEAVRYDTVLQLGDGRLVPVDLSVVPITDRDDTVTHFVCAAVDISVRVQIEDHLRQTQRHLVSSLSEKETLLREIHHRVKNNLQVVSSLLSLQARRSDQPEVVEVLEESRKRVHAMSMVHERLYQSSDLERIDMRDYVESLVTSVQSAYVDEANQVIVSVECDPIELGVDQAIPLGLLINELVSNSLKHAFEDGARGTVKVAFTEECENHLKLQVADDGVGLLGVALKPKKSLGLRLVALLADQLGANLQVVRSPSAVFQVTFERTD